MARWIDPSPSMVNCFILSSVLRELSLLPGLDEPHDSSSVGMAMVSVNLSWETPHYLI